MTLFPVLNAAPVVQIHIIAGCVAILLGPVALYRRPRGLAHKCAGYAWVMAMAGLALSSFAIHGFALVGPFSPLHMLALVTLWSLWMGLRHARAGRIGLHRRVFGNLYWYGVMVAGLFNFLPGRIINQAVFPQTAELGYAVIALGLGVAVAAAVWPRAARAVT